MKTSLDWLNSYLDRPALPDEVEDLLTRQGLPIDSRVKTAHNDELLDVEVTSNRTDCLSHIGLAREVAAGSGRQLVWPQAYQRFVTRRVDDALPGAGPLPGDLPAGVSVRNDEPQLCPLYTARVIRDVRVGPSPAWLVRRLETVGLRSVNNVVDITNFVLLEIGQPLHAFDLDKLAGAQLVVRCARKNEPFVAIDGSRHVLSAGMLVIADAQKPVAVAGVMGGLDSEVTESTRHILLESAMFDPLAVRRTSRGLKLASDSSYRFERGIDPWGVEAASSRAAELIIELAGGTLAQGVFRSGQIQTAPRQVIMRLSRCNQLLGLELSPNRVVELLGCLDLEPKYNPADGTIACAVPSFRRDLEREVDLIEEVARLQGFESVPVYEKISIVAQPQTPAVTARQKLGQILAAHSWHETLNFTFLGAKFGQPFLNPDDQPVLVDDERRKAEPMLRPSVIPSLLLCRKSNQDVGNRDVTLFETASTWRRQPNKIIESRRLGVVCDADDPQHALRRLRAAVEDLVEQLTDLAALEVQPLAVPACSVAGRVTLAGRDLGWLGLLDPAVQRLFDLAAPVAAAELDLDLLLASYPPTIAVRELARFPVVERDLSLIVSDEVSWAQLHGQIRDLRLEFLEELRFLDVYHGKPIPPGSKSVSLRLLFRDPAGTLRREQVDAQVARAVAALEQSLGALLRQK